MHEKKEAAGLSPAGEGHGKTVPDEDGQRDVCVCVCVCACVCVGLGGVIMISVKKIGALIRKNI